MKTCIKCGISKQIEEFYKHPKMADGHLGKCKPCCIADATARRLAKLDEVRAYDRERAKRPERKAAQVARTRRWRKEDRRRMCAHNAVARALKKGAITRQDCACGRADTHAHHDDYDKPLEVRWLCPACHSAAHHAAGDDLDHNTKPSPHQGEAGNE